MVDTLSDYFSSSGFMPHGHCFLWTPSLLWIYVASDFVIAASYFSIPFALWYFVQKRRDLPFAWMFSMFGVFVLACGSTHLFAVWNIWHADYWADAGIKAFTAIASAATAILFWPLIPKALTIPSHAQLESANRELLSQINLRERAEVALRLANETLERGVAERTVELKNANISLRNSEQRLAGILNSQDTFICRMDPQFRMTYMNEAFARAHETRIGDVASTNVHLDDVERAQTALAELQNPPHRCIVEVRNQIRGEWRWVRWENSVVRDKVGELVEIQSVGTDTTERRQAQERLEESEERLRPIFEGALDGILVADANTGKFQAANPAVCNMLGYTIEEMSHLGVADIHREEDLSHAMEQFARLRHGEIQIAAEIPMMRKDGSVLYADIKGAPIHLGGRDCLLGIFRDITERKKAEKALRDAEEQFRGLVEQSIAGTYIVQDGKFAYVNPRCAEIFGYDSADEMIGCDVLTVVAEKDRNTVLENIRQRIEGEVRSVSYDFTGLRKDGSMTVIGVHGARASHRGRPAVIELIQDISEKKRAEEAIFRHVEELKTALMSTVEVATTLSEMRDPYTAGHERRVGEIAVAIGIELGFDAHRQEGLRVAGYLHDIGKMTIPSEILSKPGKLSAIEFQLIQGHSQASYDVLKAVKWPWPVAQIALQHHERMDGSGYPHGLKGEAILLEARIMALADVVEAMSSHRPYRPGLGIDEALAEIERGRGSVYDPVVADACLRLFREKRYQLPA